VPSLYKLSIRPGKEERKKKEISSKPKVHIPERSRITEERGKKNVRRNTSNLMKGKGEKKKGKRRLFQILEKKKKKTVSRGGEGLGMA